MAKRREKVGKNQKLHKTVRRFTGSGLLGFFRHATGSGFNSVEDLLRFNIGLSNRIIGFGLFAFLTWPKLEVSKYFGSFETNPKLALLRGKVAQVANPDFQRGLLSFVQDKGWTFLLAVTTFYWFTTYAAATKKETEIMINAFSPDAAPHDLNKLAGKGAITALAIGLTATFILLGWLTDNIRAYAFVCIWISVFDLVGNEKVSSNLRAFFADPKYRIPDSPTSIGFRQRRKIVAEYYLKRNHQGRVILHLFLNALACICALSEPIFQIHLWLGLPYLIIAGAYGWNQWLLRKWRFRRDQRLAHSKQLETRRRQLRELSQSTGSLSHLVVGSASDVVKA